MKKLSYLIIICAAALFFVNQAGASAVAVPTAIFEVDNDGDSGTYVAGVTCTTGIPNDCSLRQAIKAANNSAGTDVIRFDLTSYPSGMVIRPNSEYPEIVRPVEIDGVTGTGGNCATASDPATLPVTIDGVNQSSGPAFTLHDANPNTVFFTTSNNSTIRGLNIINFPGSAIFIDATSFHSIVCNHIGVADGDTAAGNLTGVNLIGDADDIVIGGPTPSDRNVISSNLLDGVRLDSFAATDNTIEGNYIGLDKSGNSVRGNSESGLDLAGTLTVVRGNFIAGSGLHGIEIETDTSVQHYEIEDNVIGLAVNGNRVGNLRDGIYAEDVTPSGVSASLNISNNKIGGNARNGITVIDLDVTLTNNRIGTTLDGTGTRANNGDGINIVADGATLSLNVVSGNGDRGVYIEGDNALVTTNQVGTTLGGGSALGNGSTGVHIVGNSAEISTANVISGNDGNGLLIEGDDATINFNHFGVTAAGNGPLGNGLSGVRIIGANAIIGGNAVGDRNIIGDNGKSGITLISNDTTDAVIRNNHIGVGKDGSTALGNGQHGVSIELDAKDNRVGQVGAENIIVNNALNGINVQGLLSIRNDLRDNVIDDNGALGIDLNEGGPGGEVTLNDSPDLDNGPNGQQNFMELFSAEASGRVQGTLVGFDGLYTIEIYQRNSCDGSGYGEGGDNRILYIPAASISGGQLDFDQVLSPAPPLGKYLVSLVTDADGNTSEFGNCVQVVEASFVVNSTANFGDNNEGDGDCISNVTGDCTLRAVIEEVNALEGGPYAISFHFGLVGFTRVIMPEDSAEIPAITTPITLDASAVGNSTCPSSSAAAAHFLVLDGSNLTSGDGLRLASTASGSTIRGLSIRNFPGDGIQVNGDNNVIACNTISNNGAQGVDVLGNDNRIGGTARSERNVIINSGSHGVELRDGATRNKVQGNYIGISGDGSTAAGNGDNGVALTAAAINRIGGSVGFAMNVIGKNQTHGVYVDGASNGTQVFGNLIGLDATGLVAAGNMGSGVYAESNSNDIGGDSDSKRNVIAANNDEGIYLGGNSNVVQRNYIGTDSSGLNDLGNGGNGVHVEDGDTNLIGGDREEDGNLIAGNGGAGIRVAGNVVFTTINNNLIGVDSAENALGNSSNAIYLGEFTTQATIRDNTLANSGLDGIAVAATSVLNNFSRNRIYGNAGLGIDLNNDTMINANDSGDDDSGSNGLMNFPELLEANADNNVVSILLDTHATVTPISYRIHVYRSPTCEDRDGNGHGQGQRFVGSFDVTTASGNGIVQDAAMLTGNFNLGEQLTATATPLTSTHPQDGTSEFSACFTATGSVPTAVQLHAQTVANEWALLALLSLGLVVLTGVGWFRPKSSLMHPD